MFPLSLLPLVNMAVHSRDMGQHEQNDRSPAVTKLVLFISSRRSSFADLVARGAVRFFSKSIKYLKMTQDRLASCVCQQ